MRLKKSEPHRLRPNDVSVESPASPAFAFRTDRRHTQMRFRACLLIAFVNIRKCRVFTLLHDLRGSLHVTIEVPHRLLFIGSCMQRNLITFGALLLLLPGAFGARVYAQATATVRGVVKDPSSAVVPGATVVFSGNGVQQTVKTDG